MKFLIVDVSKILAISDRDVQQKLQHLITEGRKDIYCRAFSKSRTEEIRS